MSWLKGYWKLEEEISFIEWNLKRERLGPDEECSIEELENQLQEKMMLKQELIDIINTFKGLDNQILKLYYIDGITLVKVAEELGYSYNYIKQRHADFIRTIKFAKENKANKGR